MNRSRVHMFNVAAARLEEDHANPKLVADIREAAKAEAKRIVEGRAYSEEDQKRIERQRTLFALLPPYAACERLKAAMLQRAYDLMWDGDASGCDVLAEFLPEREVEKMFEAWESDTMVKNDADRSAYYRSEILSQ